MIGKHNCCLEVMVFLKIYLADFSQLKDFIALSFDGNITKCCISAITCR